MKTAVIYARYSSDNQTEQSIDGQLRVCHEYAQRNDILILDTYIDRAMTGTNDLRPDFQRMLKNSVKREWNYVLVYKLDRFSRNKYEMAMHKKTLKDNGTKVISATEFIPDTPEGIIFESMLEGYAEYYSAELSQKVRRGINESRLKGNLTGGRVLYGYMNVNKKAVINEEQAEVVRYIFEEYSKGVYVKDIIASLTRKGIYYNGKPFCRTTVYKILGNERYSGIYRHGEQVFENTFPRIVPQEIFDKVKGKIDMNKYGKTSVKIEYLLKGKLKCGYCGLSMNAENGTARNGERKYYYKCWGRKHATKCHKEAIQKDLLETIVLDEIRQQLNDKNNVNVIVQGLMALQMKLNKENNALNNLLQTKRQVDTALQNIMNAIENGIFSNTTNKRLHDLEEQQANLEKEILIEKSKTAVVLSEKEIREFYEQALRLEPQMLINYLVKEILVYDDEIVIKYNTPTTISPDESQGFSFYHKTLKFAYKVRQRRDMKKFEIKVEIRV